MKRLILAYTLLTASIVAFGATITLDGTTTTFIESTEVGSLAYTFKKCMANDLFTFYEVTLDGKVVNSAKHSDNIGPFLVSGQGWVGGNHLSDTGKKSAKCIDVSIEVDGEIVESGTHEGRTMVVNTVNELYLPDGSIFALETVKYQVTGNSIEVWVEHDYKIADELTVDRYYGMQSMFVGETEILAPGVNKYNKWLTFTPGGADNSIRIKNCEAPKLSVFIEKSADAYQASYMKPEGLGSRIKVGVDDVVYIGNSYEKSYHKTMGMATVRPGDATHWHGVYSWFKEPTKDTFRSGDDSPEFEYPAYIDGNAVTLSVNDKGVTRVRCQDCKNF